MKPMERRVRPGVRPISCCWAASISEDVELPDIDMSVSKYPRLTAFRPPPVSWSL